MADAPIRYTLPRTARLRSRKAFARIFKRRQRVSDGWLTLYAAPNEEGQARLGISIGRRYGNAVQRNRTKRLIREAYRHVRHDLPVGLDYVVIPRPGQEPTAAQLQKSLTTLADRLARRISRS